MRRSAPGKSDNTQIFEDSYKSIRPRSITRLVGGRLNHQLHDCACWGRYLRVGSNRIGAGLGRATAADVLECQLPLITEPPAVVTITMGGNDLLMASHPT
jgi:hypothetical protein